MGQVADSHCSSCIPWECNEEQLVQFAENSVGYAFSEDLSLELWHLLEAILKKEFSPNYIVYDLVTCMLSQAIAIQTCSPESTRLTCGGSIYPHIEAL